MMNNDASKLLERNRVGALLRIFSASPEMIDHQIQSALTAARKLHALEINGKRVFSRIDFLVSNDSRYEDSDCLQTTQRLRSVLDGEFDDASIRVLDIKNGDIFCMLLNYGVAHQLEDRIPYSFIITHTAHEYITEKNVSNMLAAMQNKARVAGLAIKDLHEGVMEGRIANTFSVWHNKSLLTVGGFDLRAAKPLKDEECKQITGVCLPGVIDGIDTELVYHIAGSEEIIPIIRLIKNFGACIQPIEAEDVTHAWGAHPEIDHHGNRRHLAKLATKKQRQEYFAHLEHETLGFIKTGIL